MSRSKNHPTVYATAGELKDKNVNLSQYPSAGPRANITGMKNKYWGRGAYVVKHGTYIYNVPRSIYVLLGGSAPKK
jgi:hypothetical protein